MTEGDLLNKLESKYERPSPGPCTVCSGEVVVAHKGGGLPLRWVCVAALAQVEKGVDVEAAQAHIEESVWLDYRKMGDARVMQLIRMYRELRAKLQDAAEVRELEYVGE